MLVSICSPVLKRKCALSTCTLLSARSGFSLNKLTLHSGPLGENQQQRLDALLFILPSTDLKWCALVCRLSLERLYQAPLPLSGVNSVPAELLSSHQALLLEARTRLHHLQEYQAFGEALRAVRDWLEEVKTRLESLDSTEGKKDEVEDRLERVQV